MPPVGRTRRAPEGLRCPCGPSRSPEPMVRPAARRRTARRGRHRRPRRLVRRRGRPARGTDAGQCRGRAVAGRARRADVPSAVPACDVCGGRCRGDWLPRPRLPVWPGLPPVARRAGYRGDGRVPGVGLHPDRAGIRHPGGVAHGPVPGRRGAAGLAGRPGRVRRRVRAVALPAGAPRPGAGHRGGGAAAARSGCGSPGSCTTCSATTYR